MSSPSSAPSHSDGHKGSSPAAPAAPSHSAASGNPGKPAAPASSGGPKASSGTPSAPSHEGSKASSGTPAAPASGGGPKASAGTPAAPAHEGHKANATPAAPSHDGAKASAGTPAAPAHQGHKASAGTPAAPAHDGAKANAGKPGAPSHDGGDAGKKALPPVLADSTSKGSLPTHEVKSPTAKHEPAPADPQKAGPPATGEAAVRLDNHISTLAVKMADAVTAEMRPDLRANAAQANRDREIKGLKEKFENLPAAWSEQTVRRLNALPAPAVLQVLDSNWDLTDPHARVVFDSILAEAEAKAPPDPKPQPHSGVDLDALLSKTMSQASKDFPPSAGSYSGVATDPDFQEKLLKALTKTGEARGSSAAANKVLDDQLAALQKTTPALAGLTGEQLRQMALYSVNEIIGNAVHAPGVNQQAAQQVLSQFQAVLNQRITDPAAVQQLLQQAASLTRTEGSPLDLQAALSYRANELARNNIVLPTWVQPIQISLEAIARQPGASKQTVAALQQMFQEQLTILTKAGPAAKMADVDSQFRSAIQKQLDQMTASEGVDHQSVLMLQLELDSVAATGNDLWFVPPIIPEPAPTPAPTPTPVHAGPAPAPTHAGPAPAAPAPAPAAPAPAVAPAQPVTAAAATSQPQAAQGGPRQAAPVTLGQVRQHVVSQQGVAGERLRVTDANLVAQEKAAGFDPDKLPASAALEHLKALEMANRAHQVQAQLDGLTGKPGADPQTVKALQQELAYLNGAGWSAAVDDLNAALARLIKPPAATDPSWGAPDPIQGDDGSGLLPHLHK